MADEPPKTNLPEPTNEPVQYKFSEDGGTKPTKLPESSPGQPYKNDPGPTRLPNPNNGVPYKKGQ